jgi:hypothetical protein
MSRAIAVLLAAALVGAWPASSFADEPVAEVSRPSPLAAYGGWSAWSAADASGRYVLQLRAPDGSVRPAPYPSSSRPWDVSLGPDAAGRPVAVLRRCTARGCDLQRLDLQRGSAQALRSVSSPSFEEATPAIWRSTVVFTRRVRGCDVPYVKNLRSSAPSRRLLRTKCLQTPAGHVSVRGTRILVSSVDLSQAPDGVGVKVSEVRRYSARGGGSSVLARQTFGEESNLFGQVAQDERFAWTVRIGVNRPNTFVRIPLGTGQTREVRAYRILEGGFAHTADQGSLYVELPEEAGCSTFTAVPCRIVAAPVEQFVGTGLTASTGADGSWAITLRSLTGEPWYTAVAATAGAATWAGRGTVGSTMP